ncbi:MFS transporter [Bradyrhizobium sp. LHD-71]|uniref:MFS transporter n=1 Tax=Bradyrhizobium sp. LHD-71 TaxID=3072141 RepID=UPI00280E8C68|nr:MFS transporter [Bradyrhizobium sp. LHD-71]MDQ8726790.1 MFS transporter [Bradyrhizobium sp. LHD-71]
MFRSIVTAPTRAITVLSVTQILGWGALYYPPALAAPLIAAETGWSFTLAMFGFSIGLGVSGLASPFACGMVDRRGGNLVMSVGALVGACGLIAIALAGNPIVYLLAWVLIGIAMASTLYDASFSTLTYLFGTAARRPITIVTFAGGLAGTVAWPATHGLIEVVGWRGAYLVFAAILALVVAPLHAFALPREKIVAPATPHAPSAAPPAKFLAPRGLPFVLIAAGFSVHAFVMSGIAAHLLGMLQRGGIDAGSAVMVGALIGPAQVVSRFADFATRGRAHPLWIARMGMALMAAAFVLLLLGGISFEHAALFAIVYGTANGIMTIARGALTLLLFGPVGYGQVLGRIARPAQILQATAPFVLAFVIDWSSDAAVLAISAVATLVAMSCFWMLKRPA